MALDYSTLKRVVDKNGPVSRILILEIKGSTPRGSGTEMYVWANGIEGTIGGGTLEFEAIKSAQEILKTRKTKLKSYPLGPELGQCCGGHVKLLTEYYDEKAVTNLKDQSLNIRSLSGAKEAPKKVKKLINKYKNEQISFDHKLSDEWLIEKIITARSPIWIWGAGHVGSAIVSLLAPMPNLEIYWLDTDNSRFPDLEFSNVYKIIYDSPEQFIKRAHPNAEHLILTYSHKIDLEICDKILNHDFKWVGLIGSKTKFNRFKKKLLSFGHTEKTIDQIQCPIGYKNYGKHPQQIALSVAVNWLERNHELEKGLIFDKKIA
ncbi:MAG: xanthine dehydrogenase accessory protein XdhC [Paracoccaceae bacterium]